VETFSPAATIGWLAIGFAFLEYREPSFVVTVFDGLIIAVAVTT
jgi:hypothetical protein